LFILDQKTYQYRFEDEKLLPVFVGIGQEGFGVREFER